MQKPIGAIGVIICLTLLLNDFDDAVNINAHLLDRLTLLLCSSG